MEIEIRSKLFKRKLWSEHSWPIRPDIDFANFLVSQCTRTEEALLLGATPLFVKELLRKGSRKITVVDKSMDSLEIFFEELGGRPPQVIPVCNEWGDFVTSTKQKWDCILMDNGLFFVPTSLHEYLIGAIPKMLKDTGDTFVSRQMICGSRAECRSIWRGAFSQYPDNTMISTIYLANSFIAARYGKKRVNYRHLQRLACITRKKLIQNWPKDISRTQVELIEAFIRVNINDPTFKPELINLCSLTGLKLLFLKYFRHVASLPVKGPLRSFQCVMIGGI